MKIDDPHVYLTLLLAKLKVLGFRRHSFGPSAWPRPVVPDHWIPLAVISFQLEFLEPVPFEERDRDQDVWVLG